MSNRDRDRVKKGPKERGMIALSYEILEDLLNLEPGSIRAVDLDPKTESIRIIHDDTSMVGVFKIGEHQQIVQSRPNNAKMVHTLKEKSPPA
jgi:hypothetical protein